MQILQNLGLMSTPMLLSSYQLKDATTTVCLPLFLPSGDNDGKAREQTGSAAASGCKCCLRFTTC